ncbi:hypothetical protein QYM36_011004 [Artemia franciscana]|uniref:PiggyBac transposable element-derived protein domain-containing protein n=1 Tax=Artemia franciscana TaxID=6661 RepID=A0AA88HQQ6_ARTSF|nr:hypothetical protein QYM36_011004 [Artemia franciscana]
MSRDSFTSIRRYLHFNDNSKCKPKTDPGHDRLFKVRPIVDLLQENLMRTEPEERHITDEQIIPFKGRSVMMRTDGRKGNERFCMGNVDWRVEKSTDVCLVRWYDNKAVTLVSNYVAVDPKDTCRRWDSSENKYVEIERPAVFKEYNKYMGGVD